MLASMGYLLGGADSEWTLNPYAPVVNLAQVPRRCEFQGECFIINSALCLLQMASTLGSHIFGGYLLQASTAQPSVMLATCQCCTLIGVFRGIGLLEKPSILHPKGNITYEKA